MSKRVFISVGDFSGDQHAAKFISALRERMPDVAIDGIGGDAMRDAGANLLHETVSGAIMGLAAAFRAFEVAKLFKRIEAHWVANKTDLLVCIDSSGMNLPLAKRAKKHGLKVLYYIAPQLWASRPGRIKKVRAFVDRIACILPFEEEWYRERGVTATFVGHPLFDDIPADRVERSSTLPRFPDRQPVIGIVAGSRRAEIKGNLPRLLECAGAIRGAYPDASFLLPTTRTTDELVRQMHGQDARVTGSAFTIKSDASDELIPQCDLVLCKSGTSTLHTAVYGVPMIMVYRLNRILWRPMRWMFIRTKQIALINVLAGQREVVPELLGNWQASDATRIALDWLGHPEKLRAMRRELLEIVEPLDRKGASVNASKIALEMIS